MKAWAPYVLPTSFLLLIAGSGVWYFYSRVNLVLDATRLGKPESLPTQAVKPVQDKPALDQEIEKLKGLFGSPKAIQPKAVKEKEKPESAIALHGVFAGSGARKAAAIISTDGGKQRIYYVGDSVTDELQLVSVQEKEILVKDASGLRSVRLERNLDGDKAVPSALDRPTQNSLKNARSIDDAAPQPGPAVKGGWSLDKDVSGKLSRLKSLAHEERK